jgi:hypothetical protein
MKMHIAGFAAAALLLATTSLPGHAEDAPAAGTPPAQAAPAQTTPTDAKPAAVPRPSIAPKATEAAPSDATAEPAPRQHRRHARYHYRRYAYWEPFPIYFPHLYRSRIVWNRVPWF